MSEKKPLIALSASRLKVLKDCSWLYWCKYGPMKLPDKTNKGALCGTCCHEVFEKLMEPENRAWHDKLVQQPATIRNCPEIEKFVREYIDTHKLDPDEDFKFIDAMIVVGLMYDFYCQKGQGQEVVAEHQFDIVNENPPFRIMGFMDKIAKYSKKGLLRIMDYKSSKRQFEGKDLESNIQAMIYSVAARRIFPDLIPIVEFIFLQFPEKPVQRLRFSDAQLQDFEKYLGRMSNLINNFSIQDALKNFAKDKGMPTDGGFSGTLMCGFAKTAGELKKDGKPKWACQYKFPFDYFALCNDKDEVVKTSYEDNLKPDETKGQYVIKKHYAGCPAWNGTRRKLKGA